METQTNLSRMLTAGETISDELNERENHLSDEDIRLSKSLLNNLKKKLTKDKEAEALKKIKKGTQSWQQILEYSGYYQGAENEFKEYIKTGQKSQFLNQLENDFFEKKLAHFKNKNKTGSKKENELDDGLDGTFGDSTELATCYFQFSHNLPINGSVGNEEMVLLESIVVGDKTIKNNQKLLKAIQNPNLWAIED